MAIEIRVPTEEQFPELVTADGRGFGFVPTPDDIAERRSLIDLDRFRVAIDRGRIVGVAGSFAFDMTLPGGSTVPMSGVTWVSVTPTHRRQGIVTELMAAVLNDADDRGEPVATLFASEGTIYERFGFGIASWTHRMTIDRRAAQLRPDLPVRPGTVRFLAADEARVHEAEVWERFRRLRPGEVSRSPEWHDRYAELRARAAGDLGPAFHLAHPDGSAVYRIAEHWDVGIPGNQLEVVELAAATPAAYLELWHALLGVDLVATITSHHAPPDDGLVHLMVDNRAVNTVRVKDGLWANVRDVAICFGARSYGTADRLVVEVDGRRWAIESDGTESSCRAVRTRPDLVTDVPTMGALLLGGIRPSALAGGRRIEARSPDALRRADAFFVTGPPPHCQTWF